MDDNEGDAVSECETEMGEGGIPTTADDESGTDPCHTLHKAFCAACHGILDDDSLSAAQKLAQIKALLMQEDKTRAAIGGKSEPSDVSPSEDNHAGSGAGMDETTPAKAIKESLQQRAVIHGLQRVRRDLEQRLAGTRFLLETRGVKAPDAMLDAIGKEQDHNGRVALLESFASLVPRKENASRPAFSKPRSAAPVPFPQNLPSLSHQSAIEKLMAGLRRG